MNIPDGQAYLRHFPRWLQWAEPHWHATDGGRGYFGAGTGAVLDHSATVGYLAACVSLAIGPESLRAECHLSLDELAQRASRAFRYIVAAHVSQAGRAPDKSSWGLHWGSPIVLERMANAVDGLEPWLTPADRAAWRSVLTAEAEYLLNVPIEHNRFGLRAETFGERNYWRGSLLFRAARLYPEHPRSAAWLERSSIFCLNALSMPEDAQAGTVVDGRPLCDWHQGANMHPGALFEHHGVLSLDYSIIAESFFVMAMIGTLRHHWTPTQALFHHMGDLWRFIRRCILPDGRVVCFGKQRPRYSIMYHYLLPCLVFWARHGGDPAAWELARALERLADADCVAAGDGSFLGARGEGLRLLHADERPYYYFRLEADAILARSYACMLFSAPETRLAPGPTCGAVGQIEESIAQPLISSEAGLVFRRGARALCAVYWHRSEKAESDPPLALVVPAGHGHRVDWLSNLATIFKPLRERHVARAWRAEACGAGFITAGRINEGWPLLSDDGAGYAIEQQMVFVMMPDGRALLRIEIARALRPVLLLEIAGLNLNLANDIFTGNQFELVSAAGARHVPGIGGADEEIEIPSPWVCLPNELGVVAVGAVLPFVLATTSRRRRAYESLLVERLCWPLRREPHLYGTNDLILDTAVWLLPNVTPAETEQFHERLQWQVHAAESGLLLRTFSYFGRDAGLLINLTDTTQTVAESSLRAFAGLTPATPAWPNGRSTLEPWKSVLFLSEKAMRNH
ncbi:MAG: hypothetical protein PHW60_13875 [Kiritimatiellae bacterium]|nr:hypothetical protein [Kiritimatiellia bacterium]